MQKGRKKEGKIRKVLFLSFLFMMDCWCCTLLYLNYDDGGHGMKKKKKSC